MEKDTFGYREFYFCIQKIVRRFAKVDAKNSTFGVYCVTSTEGIDLFFIQPSDRGEAMPELVVAAFGDVHKAEEVRLDLLKMEKAHLADLEDAVVLLRTRKGKVKLHHMSHPTLSGAMAGGLVGALMGVILLNPVFSVLGFVEGSAIGAASRFADHMGIEKEFLKQLADHLQPNTSALCILVQGNLDKVLDELGKFDAKVFRTSMQHKDEQELEAKLEAVKSEVEGAK